MTRVAVLNNDYTFLNFTSWKRAISLIYQGKAEPIETNKVQKIFKNFEGTIKIVLPYAIRLMKYVREIFYKNVPYSRRHILERDGKCQYCGSTRDLTVDHVIPKSRGGKSTWENCVAACKKCNYKKGNRTPSEANMYLLKQPVAPTINEFVQMKMRKLGIDKFIMDLFNV